MRYLVGIFFVLALASCGVITDSSKPLQDSGGGIGTGGGSTGTTPPTDTNGSGTTDTNTTSGSDTNVTAEALYDTSDGAELDPNACYSGYATAVPLQDSADSNSQRETDDDLNGISLMSLYPQTFDPADSNVIAFYKTLPLGTVLQSATKRKNIYGDNSQFILVYDPTWVNTPENKVYIQTPKLQNKLPSCYRIVINSLDGSSVVPQKVYRNRK